MLKSLINNNPTAKENFKRCGTLSGKFKNMSSSTYLNSTDSSEANESSYDAFGTSSKSFYEGSNRCKEYKKPLCPSYRSYKYDACAVETGEMLSSTNCFDNSDCECILEEKHDNSIRIHASSLFSAMKGKAEKLLTNIRKDASSSKAMHSIENSTKSEAVFDMTYLTSRIAVMSYPSQGNDEPNNCNDICAYLDLRHQHHNAVYNFTTRQFDNARVMNMGWSAKAAPPLHSIITVCQHIVQWLQRHPQNIAVLLCLNGRAQSALVFCSLMVLCKLFKTVQYALFMFTSKRMPPGFSPSFERYLTYMDIITLGPDPQQVDDAKSYPHSFPLTISKVEMSSISHLACNKNSCLSSYEIHIGEKQTYSISYESMRDFTSEQSKVQIYLGTKVGGAAESDIILSIHHVRGMQKETSKLGTKRINTKMFQVQFNTGFVPVKATEIHFKRCDLDTCDGQEIYPESFCLTLHVKVHCENSNATSPDSWKGFNENKNVPKLLFLKVQEQKEALQLFGKHELETISPSIHYTIPDVQELPVIKKTAEGPTTCGAAAFFEESPCFEAHFEDAFGKVSCNQDNDLCDLVFDVKEQLTLEKSKDSQTHVQLASVNSPSIADTTGVVGTAPDNQSNISSYIQFEPFDSLVSAAPVLRTRSCPISNTSTMQDISWFDDFQGTEGFLDYNNKEALIQKAEFPLNTTSSLENKSNPSTQSLLRDCQPLMHSTTQLSPVAHHISDELTNFLTTSADSEDWLPNSEFLGRSQLQEYTKERTGLVKCPARKIYHSKSLFQPTLPNFKLSSFDATNQETNAPTLKRFGDGMRAEDKKSKFTENTFSDLLIDASFDTTVMGDSIKLL